MPVSVSIADIGAAASLVDSLCEEQSGAGYGVSVTGSRS
jgi:hypothetical protein